MVRARFAVPVHWGTLHPPWALHLGRRWFDLPGEWFTGALAEHAPAATSIVLAPGQSWSVPE